MLLERRQVEREGAVAVYRAALFTPDASFEYEARLAADGSATLTAVGDSAPLELEHKLVAHARHLARGAQRNQRGGLPLWPHRLLRWRPLGAGPGRSL